jgi:type I restriction enzyme S subunit
MANQPNVNTVSPSSDDWPVIRLGEVLSPVDRSSRRLVVQDDETYSLLSAQLYGRGIVPKDRVSGESLKTKVWFRVKRKDFLLLKIWARKGSYGFVKESYPNAIVSGDYPILSLNQDRADEAFVEFFLSMPEAWANLSQGAKGSTNRQRVHETEFIRLIRIPLPPLKEQRAIAHVLRTVQQAREATEKVIAAARQLKQSIMRHLFTYGPVPVEQADQVPLKETQFGFVPKHWPVFPVGEVCKSIVPGRTKPKVFDGAIPWITMPDLKDSVIVSRSRAGLALSEIAIAEVHAKIIPSGSVVMSCIGEFGIVVVVENDVVVNQQLHAFVCPSHLIPYFLFHALRMKKSFMDRIAHFTTLPYLSKDKCNSVPIPVPPLNEQVRIVEALKAIDRKIAHEESYLSSLGALFQTLLHSLMAGKLRVNSTEPSVTAEGALCP